ncbi:MAG: hypothetical protein J5705_01635 [Bacteroidaceae bacterium]|nr:hypothetical protein [Bacteroidaceae bacterium]
MINRAFFISLLLCVVFSSCDISQSKQVKRAVKHNIGRVIDISCLNKQIISDTISVIEEWETPPLMIISEISKTMCTECLVHYLQAAEYYIKTFNSDSICFVAVFSSETQLAIRDSIREISPNVVKVFYDEKAEYLNNYGIKKVFGRWNVFLVNKNKKIMLMGDPLGSLKLKDLYDKTIAEQLDNMK